MKTIRTVSLILALLFTLTALPILPVSAAERVNISSEKVTVIYVSEQCEEFHGNLYRETTLGDPYFDGVRGGDWFTIPIHVEKAGDYHFCFSFGWVDATGHYTIDVDGTSVELINKEPGSGWRAWRDTSEAVIKLTAGDHTLKVTNHTAGPNIRALKIAPAGVPLTYKEPGGTLEAYDNTHGLTAVQMRDTYAVQFKIASSFDYIELHSASWNNSKGSLDLSLYKWNGNYDTTVNGQPLLSETFIDFFDGAVLRLKGKEALPAGEYLLYITNISEDRSEAVGFWAFDGNTQNVRNYKEDAETTTSARVDVHYLEDKDMMLEPISPANGSGEGLSPSAGDLFPWGEASPFALGADGLVGLHFKADTPFTGAEVYVAASPVGGGQMTLFMYQWDQNYSTTVKASPLATKTVKGLTRSTWTGMSGSFDAGEYLLVLSEGTDKLALATVPTRSGLSVTYLHTSAITGMSLVARLTGEGVKVSAPSAAAPQTYVSSGTWVGVDGLGRELPTYEQVGGIREGKYVGIFFHTWHASMAPEREIINATQTIAKYPEAAHDFNHPAWGGVTTCFWNEPIWGYYNTVDHWVLRKQAELLADAGVDVVFFDNTNGTMNFMSAILELCAVWAEARADGVKTPQISALLNMYNYDETAMQIADLYDQIYSKGLYEDLWFKWEGKPLLIAYPNHLNNIGRPEITNFFTYRTVNPAYTTNNDLILPHEGSDGVKFAPESGFGRYTAWKWISVYPQQQMKNRSTKEVEEMCVSVAQNWSAGKGLTAMNAGDLVFGRGYTNAHGVDTSDYAVTHGLNFAEQFEYALEVDPDFIWITGWNEWVAGRYEEMWGDPNAIPDNALDGYSRDIEPSTGLLKDHFYYQMVSYIRRFKGVEAPAGAQAPTQAGAAGTAIDWNAVTSVYPSYGGNTLHRDHDGYRGYHYTNTTGRNDIVESRVTYDAQNLYFYVRTAAPLTPETDPAWMRLFLDTGADIESANWEGFEYVVNRVNPVSGKAVIERSTGGWNWKKAAEVDYSVDGDTLVITIPREVVGVEAAGAAVNFKWSDNMQADGDVMNFYVDGDAAPGGRFKYSFVLGEAVGTETDTTAETAPETTADTQSTNKGKGCKSVVGTASAVAGIALAAISLRKKKED